MRFDIITAFPEAFSYFDTSIIKRAKAKEIAEVHLWHLRDFTTDKHRTIDDRPFGGGPGMVLKVEPIWKALQKVKKSSRITDRRSRILLTSLKGKAFTQRKAHEYAKCDQLVIICGHYEGVDERVKRFIDEEVSVGKYVLSGGELAAMVITDAVIRLLPAALGNPDSLEDKRFTENRGKRKEGGLVSYPVYTRPEVFSPKKGVALKTPKVLLSGDHKKIQEWIEQHKRAIKF